MEVAESISLPTFVVADAGRTQVILYMWLKIDNGTTLNILSWSCCVVLRKSM